MSESVYQQSPEFVSLTKINGTIHSLHTFFLKPLFCCVEKYKCRAFVINTFKKSDASCGLFIGICQAMIYKSSYSPGQIVIIICQNPPLNNSMSEISVPARIKHCLNIIIKRAYPG